MELMYVLMYTYLLAGQNS